MSTTHFSPHHQVINGRCLHTLFEQQAAHLPNQTALIFEATKVSYKTLNQKANQLAHQLQKHGIGPETTVGVFMERDVNLIVSLLAVLKAGGAYVPLDPLYPAERVAFMLEDGAAPVILSQESLRHKIPANQAHVIYVDSEWNSKIANEPTSNPAAPVQPDNLAYLIYTSGSTGKPKGVAIRHRNAAALIAWAATVFSVEELSGMLAVTSICFDLSIFELFLPLAQGGTIILAKNALHLLSLPAREQVKLINTVPSAIAELVKVNGIPDATVTVNLAGEPLSRALVDRVYAQGKNVQRVYNLYGPSEDTTYSTYTLVDRESRDEPTIGRPISGTVGYILDQDRQPVPAGEMGELYLGGAGVARGYLNRPPLTAERFIPNPFGEGVLYKTGDLVHELPNGEWMYHGRIDHQVKIRGFRIELGEIEAALSQHANIFSQTVLAREDTPGEKQLVAYFVPKKEPLPTVTELRRHLQQTLPDYMIPTTFVPMTEMPLTPNGKIDREALPAPQQHRPTLAANYVSPRNAAETAIAAAWQEVLQVERVGVFDNFFELGGHSLMATRVLARLAAVGISLTQADFFAAPTVAELAALAGANQEQAVNIPLVATGAGEGKRPFPLSFTQRRIWFMEKLVTHTPMYNVAADFQLRGLIDIPLLEQCLNQIIQRHAPLRAVFHEIDGEPYQTIQPELCVRLDVVDLSHLPETARHHEVQKLRLAQVQTRFNLHTGPLIRAQFVQLTDTNGQLFITTHHLVADGWSNGIIMQELGELYGALQGDNHSSLSPLPVQYADYVQWEQQQWQGELLERVLAQWQTKFGERVPILQLPTDYPRPAIATHRGTKLSHPLNPDLYAAIEAFSQAHNVSPFMTMFAAFAVLLHHQSGQDKFVIGAPMANRSHYRLERLVGQFTNSLPLPVDLSHNPTFAEFLAQVRTLSFEAFAHQSLPVEKLMERLNLVRDLSYMPLFQVMFAWQNMPLQPVDSPDFQLAMLPEPDTGMAQFDLILFTEFVDDQVLTTVEYGTDLFIESTIDRFLEAYNQLLQHIVADPSRPVADLHFAERRTQSPARALEQPLRAGAVFAPARQETERFIADVWRAVLPVEKVGIHDNFFDLGGHSLLLVRVHSRLSEICPELTVLDLFKYPTIHELAARIDGTASGIASENVPAHSAQPVRDTKDDIAIVGMAGRFPGAESIRPFWQNMAAGVESITFFSDDALRQAGVDPDTLQQPNYVKAGAPLARIDQFDAEFFNYTPREAQLTDPQHRLFLECAWEALEDSGYVPSSFAGDIGVFAGTGPSDYLTNNLVTNPDLLNSAGDLQTVISTDKDFVPTRVSYKLNLTGPSLTVQTACSTSLVAIHLACQSLRTHECDMALAGGVSISLPHGQGYLHTEGSIYSPDGHCRAFDADAAGTVVSNGAAIVVLKRLADALADGDHIVAVIKGSAINNDGAQKVGYTAPSVQGQARVIQRALHNAGVGSDSIGYVETHGTGTKLGDPIEVAALAQAFGRSLPARSCAISSLKTNVGHLNAAAGAGGLIRAALALQHQLIPPNVHFQTPNPALNLEETPFYVPAKAQPWEANGRSRGAGVSSFGIGGTNAHVILEEAPEKRPSSPSRPYQLLLLSARSEAALAQAAENLTTHLQTYPPESLADVAYTLQVGRQPFTHRWAAVVPDGQPVPISRERVHTHQAVENPSVVFMFPGGGAQYPNMGRDLYDTEPVYRRCLDDCLALLTPQLGIDIKSLIFPIPERVAEAEQELQRPLFSFPSTFITAYAMAQLWLSWGVRPFAVTGHSMGEYVAAVLAGVMSLEDALSLVVLRAQLFEQTAPGGMLSVPLSEADIIPYLTPQMAVAAVNAPDLCVVSGPVEAIAVLETRLAERQINGRRIRTHVATHSPLLDPILDTFRRRVAQIDLQLPTLPFISNVSGTWAADELTDPEYWVTHLRHQVRFAAGLAELLQTPNQLFLEVGPGQALSSLTRMQPKQHEPVFILSSMRHRHDDTSDVQVACTTLAKLWLAGVSIDWAAYYAAETRYRVSLPTYPFQRQRYWIEPRTVQLIADESEADEQSVSPDQPEDKTGTRPVKDAPATETERTIAGIWKQLLGVMQIRRFDDFFELGGHSLLGTQVLSRLKQQFMVDLPAQFIFNHRTIAAQAEAITQIQISQTQADSLDDLFAMLEEMSDEDVANLLNSTPTNGTSISAD